LSLDEVYVLEKIHGTSAHVGWSRTSGLKLFSGGIKHEEFKKVIDLKVGIENLTNLFKEYCKKYGLDGITLYGEAYGGKCQKMSHVYGPLNFIVFEVNINGNWLPVPNAEEEAKRFGFEFVWYERGPATLEWLDSKRDMPSPQAARNGLGEQYGEGIVIRTIHESLDSFGERIMAKHKRKEYRETRVPIEVKKEQDEKFNDAIEFTKQFVVPMRLEHVLDKMRADNIVVDLRNTGEVISRMIEDVRIEEGDRIVWDKHVARAIGRHTSKLYKEYLGEINKTRNNMA